MQKNFILCVMLILALCNSYAQTKWYVKPTASGNGNGTSWTNASGALQNAINDAASGDSVFVSGGIFQPGHGTSFSMKEGVKIYGGFAGTESSLSQRNLIANIAAGDSSVLKGNGNRVIYNGSNDLTAAAVIDGFTITGGTTANYGGGMYNYNSSPTIANCVFSNNSQTGNTGGGGGMYNYSNSLPTITNCTFYNNHARGSGGGMYNSSDDIWDMPSFTNCKFYSNSAGRNGGGMYNTVISPTMSNLVFADNSAGHYGGGAYGTSSGAYFGTCLFNGQ